MAKTEKFDENLLAYSQIWFGSFPEMLFNSVAIPNYLFEPKKSPWRWKKSRKTGFFVENWILGTIQKKIVKENDQ